MNNVVDQLRTMKIKYDCIDEIRSKDGVLVYRVICDESRYILKYFDKEIYRREITNYEMLQSLGVQTIHILEKTDCALLLEDIVQSNYFRLGIEQDMSDPVIATALASWYKNLHKKGEAYLASNKIDIYSENDYITLENIERISKKTNTVKNHVWDVIKEHYKQIKNQIGNLTQTITYNDFYYTNLVVSKDKLSAFMFDYNMLGKGYAYADIRNVTYSLKKDAKEAFLQAYGAFDKNEMFIDAVASTLTTLHFACLQEHIPKWALEYVMQIENGELLRAVERLI